MFIVGLTGGVGSGKSTVASLLEARGAVVIDTDVIAREVVEPETPGFEAVVDRFGRGVVSGDALDRAAIAEIVFSDPMALADLNAIVHPLVRVEVQRQLSLLDDATIAVVVVPLWVESGQYECDLLVVVDVPEEVAVERLVASRGWAEPHARGRIAAQIPREQRKAAADVLVDNTGSPADLAEIVDDVWAEIWRRREIADL